MNGYLDFDFDAWQDEADYLPDQDDPSAEIVSLSSRQIDDARTLSQRTVDRSKQWAVYLNALALAGFRHWLTSRTVNFGLNETESAILEPAIGDGTSAVCRLQANTFRLCLIAAEPEPAEDFRIPRAVMDHPDFAAHFYLPIIVYEEQGAIGLPGFLRQDQLSQLQESHDRVQQTGDAYYLPKSWLDFDLDHLLLDLSCLNAQAIPLPTHPSQPLTQRIHQLLVQPVLNTAHWFQTELQTQIEPILQALNWVVIPPATFASALRELHPSPDWTTAQTEALLDDLRQPLSQGITLAPNARAAYRTFSLGGVDLQLYAIVSLLEAPEAEAEWSLLLILKHPADQLLPAGLCLEVRDLPGLQLVQHLRASAAAGCLFTEVIGNLSEQFLVTLALNNGLAITLPPLQFQPTNA